MSDGKMSREEIVALLAMIELRVGDPDGWDVGAVSEIVKRAAFMITALEAERDEARADWVRRHQEAGDAREALRLCIEAHETGRFEPMQAAINHARVVIGTANGGRDE